MKKLLSSFLILFTVVLFFNNAVNWHYHQLPNGIVVEHAHPYDRNSSSADEPFEKHTHTDFEYLIFDLVFYSGLVIVLAFLILSLYPGPSTRSVYPGPIAGASLIPAGLPSFRAPPSI
jgi:hypothetical protein